MKGPVRFRSDMLAELFASAIAQGWAWKRGGSHVLIYPPDGGPAISLSTTAPDSPRARNQIAIAKRHGLRWRER